MTGFGFIAPIAVLVAAYVLIVLERINRAIIALLGACLVILLGILSQLRMVEFFWNYPKYGRVESPEVLVAAAEQAVFDLAADSLAADVTLGDDVESARWRAEFLYSRAATIYGGSAEIQRNIIARRLLDLGPEP